VGKRNVTPLMIDITDAAVIAAAAKAVEEVVGERGLAGLVNNAGIVKPGPLEFQPLDDFRRQLEVNLIGHLAVIQAFLPLIRRGRGRIVNVGSIGGLLALPIQGAYSASKFGLEALSDALRLELRQWKIPVSHVDPGVTQTPIFGKTLWELDRALDALHERGHAEYDAQFAAIRKVVEKSPDSAAPPEDLAEAITQALTAEKPKTRYHAGHGSKEAFVASRTLTDHAKDRVVVREVGLPRPE
jgi:NAD(P)-dependent dehydrogenase (short-subunit alcohol dehydrogenase family)